MSNDNILFTNEELAQQVDPALPPAGYQRDEELARRSDALAEAAETQLPDRERIPEKFLEPDREIQNMIAKDYLTVGVDNPMLKTKWVNYVNQHGTKVWEAKAQGWQVATAKEFPEAAHFVREDNTIRCGDVLLMCIRIDHYAKLMKAEEQKRLAQQYGLDSDVYNLAEKHPNIFANVSTEENPTLNSKTQELVNRRIKSKTAAAKVAMKSIGEQMKNPEGVRGIPLPGRPR